MILFTMISFLYHTFFTLYSHITMIYSTLLHTSIFHHYDIEEEC